MPVPRPNAFLAGMVTLAVSCASFAGAASQDAPKEAKLLLRWDLPEGTVWALHVHQQSETRVGFSGKVAQTRYDLQIDGTWRVVAQQPDQVTIHQTVDRIVMEVTTPAQTAVRFDSASQARPAPGPAADLAASLRPLVGATFELVLNRRGEVQDVRPVGQVAEQWMSRLRSDSTESAALQAAMTKALAQPFLTLPEGAVGPQDTWRHLRAEESPLGQVQVSTTYRLDQPSSQEDQTLWPIRFTSEIQVPSPQQEKNSPLPSAPQTGPGQTAGSPTTTRRNPIQVKQFEQSGTVWFSVEQSRPVSAELETRASLVHVYRDLTITADTKLRQQITLQPKSDVKSDAANPPDSKE